jgi:hypothetical protein
MQFIVVADSRAGLSALADQVVIIQKQLVDAAQWAEPVWEPPIQIELQSSVHLIGALERSRKFHTSTHDGSAIKHAYYDSGELRDWLTKALPLIRIMGPNTLPVVLFHFESKFSMLDRVHLAVPFSNMVIGVCSGVGAPIAHDFYCNGDRKRHLKVDPRSLVRPTLAAIYDSYWAVPSTHTHYDIHHNRVTTDYLWAVSNSVGGVFSHNVHASFALQHQMRRNIALAALGAQAVMLQTLVSPSLYSEDHQPLSRVMSASEFALLCQRWNLWLWKKREAEWLMSSMKYEGALNFTKRFS